MTKELTHESWEIANIIYCNLLYGPLARDYLREMLQTGTCKVEGFEFEHVVYGEKYDRERKIWLWVENNPKEIAALVA